MERGDDVKSLTVAEWRELMRIMKRTSDTMVFIAEELARVRNDQEQRITALEREVADMRAAAREEAAA